MNIRLEYSPSTGQFNQIKDHDKSEIDAGFNVIGRFVNAERARRFTEFAIHKYPALAIEEANEYPSMEQLKKELLYFLGEEIRLLNEEMSKSYERRKAIYTNQAN